MCDTRVHSGRRRSHYLHSRLEVPPSATHANTPLTQKNKPGEGRLLYLDSIDGIDDCVFCDPGDGARKQLHLDTCRGKRLVVEFVLLVRREHCCCCCCFLRCVRLRGMAAARHGLSLCEDKTLPLLGRSHRGRVEEVGPSLSRLVRLDGSGLSVCCVLGAVFFRIGESWPPSGVNVSR